MSPINEQDAQRQQEALKEALTLLNDSGTAGERYKDKLNALNKEFRDTALTIKNDFSKSISDAIKGGESFAGTFQKIRKALEDLAIKTAIINPLSDILFGGNSPALTVAKSGNDVLPSQNGNGILGSLINGVADLFGARAFGGPVGAGKPYLVGERGPELFVPQTAGRINPDVSSGHVNITMHISTQDAQSFRASEAQIAAAMMDAARRAQRIR